MYVQRMVHISEITVHAEAFSEKKGNRYILLLNHLLVYHVYKADGERKMPLRKRKKKKKAERYIESVDTHIFKLDISLSDYSTYYTVPNR